jgi:hypothetical protein
MKRLLFSAFLVAITGACLPGQCPYQSVATQSYGAGCSEVFGFFPTLRAELDTAACTFTITVDAYGGCCNTFLQGTALAIGFGTATVPLQLSDPACQLLVQPSDLFVQTGYAPGVYAFHIPPGLPPIALFAQGAGAYYTTITFPLPYSLQFSLTSGYVFILQ